MFVDIEKYIFLRLKKKITFVQIDNGKPFILKQNNITHTHSRVCMYTRNIYIYIYTYTFFCRGIIIYIL